MIPCNAADVPTVRIAPATLQSTAETGSSINIEVQIHTDDEAQHLIAPLWPMFTGIYIWNERGEEVKARPGMFLRPLPLTAETVIDVSRAMPVSEEIALIWGVDAKNVPVLRWGSSDYALPPGDYTLQLRLRSLSAKEPIVVQKRVVTIQSAYPKHKLPGRELVSNPIKLRVDP